MSQTGSVWAGLLGLQTARFDSLEVWDENESVTFLDENEAKV